MAFVKYDESTRAQFQRAASAISSINGKLLSTKLTNQQIIDLKLKRTALKAAVRDVKLAYQSTAVNVTSANADLVLTSLQALKDNPSQIYKVNGTRRSA